MVVNLSIGQITPTVGPNLYAAAVLAGDTDFANDKTFGYHASNLKTWVEEKTLGKTKASDVERYRLSLHATAMLMP